MQRITTTQPETRPMSDHQRRYILALILELSGGPFAANMEAALAAAGVPLTLRSWYEALEVAHLTTVTASGLIGALLRLKALDDAA